MAVLRAACTAAALGLAAAGSGAAPPTGFLHDWIPRAAAGASCPSDNIVSSVPLPSPLPESLQSAIAGLAPLLSQTVDPAYPAVSGKPQAAVLQIDYRGERLVQLAAGDRDPKLGAGPPSDTTIFRIGSCSKVFAVLVAFQLYDRGIVKSLDDPLSEYLPSFRVPDRFSRSTRPFTLRQLASQLSGLPREAPCEAQSFDCNITTAEVVRRLQQTPGAQWPEYTQPSYSNLAYALLGNVLAEHVGMTFEAYVVEHILSPLDMRDTGFTITNETKARLALPYTNTTLTPGYDGDIGWVAPAGQMHSTIADLMKLGRYLLGIEGKLFDDGLRREMLLPAFAYSDGAFMVGFPFEISLVQLEGESRTWEVVAKGGAIQGYSAVVATVPLLNMSMAALWSGPFLDGITFANSAFNQILPAFVSWITSARPLPRMPSQPERYVGNFALGEVGWTIAESHVSGKGQALSVLATEGGQQLSFLLDFFDDRSATLTTFGASWPGSCMMEMATAEIHQWLTFNFGNDGNVESVEAPGTYLYRTKFPRVPQVHIDTTMLTV